MKFIVKECPKCHAPIEEQSRFCSHCGTAVLLDDEATRSKYTYQKVDDARIREADVKEKIRLKELEIEHMKLQDEIHQRKQTLQMRLALVISFFAVLLVLLLMYAFVIWMLVDCIRRKLKRKVLWVLLVFLGVAFTVTVGNQIGFKFMIGLMFQNSTVDADPYIKAVVTKLVVPVGAIVYFFLRKKYTINSETEAGVIPEIGDEETA